MNILLIAVSCNQYDDLRSEISRYSNVFMLFALQHLSLQKDSKELVDKTFRISLENTVNNFNSFFDELCRYSRLNTRHVNIKELGVYCDKKLCSFLVLHELMIKDFEKINNGNDEYIKNLRKLTDKFISENFHGYSVIYKNAKQDVEYKIFEVKSDNLVDMIDKIIQMWSILYKTVDNGKQMENSTLIIPRNSFTIPGGRFREVYYWDSYWIFDGQLALGMDKIVLEGLENFVELIEKFGFIPNGNRLYYTKRSQPPYFTQMVSNYYKNATQIPLDRQKIEIYVNAMIIEYNFWMNARKCSFLHNNKRYVMNQYRVTTDYPRPEALTEDIETFKEYLAKVEKCKLNHKTIETILDGYKKGLPNPFEYAEKENMIYGNIKSAAESGWDFSTRFFADGINFYTICTRDIIPVDLNAILYSNEVIIAEFLEKLNDERSKHFREAADTRKKLINDVFWKDGSWRDYNYVKQKHHRDSFYFSNLYPMIYGIEPPEGNFYDIMYKYRKVLFGYKGGIPASDQEISDQQWDFPNVWAPHQHLFVDFLLRIKEYEMANHVAASFYRAIKSCIKGKAYVFYERYKCDTLGKPGRSGEYPVQDGFGWTNGVITRFMKIFGDKIIVSEKNHAKEYEKIVEYLKTKLSGAKTETDTCKNTRKCLQTENPRRQRDIRPHGS